MDAKEFMKSSQLNDVSSEMEIKSSSSHLANCKTILIKNLPKSKSKSIVEFYSYNLAKINVISVKLIDESAGNWLVEFEKYIGKIKKKGEEILCSV
jgi:hypothetical protein